MGTWRTSKGVRGDSKLTARTTEFLLNFPEPSLSATYFHLRPSISSQQISLSVERRKWEESGRAWGRRSSGGEAREALMRRVSRERRRTESEEEDMVSGEECLSGILVRRRKRGSSLVPLVTYLWRLTQIQAVLYPILFFVLFFFKSNKTPKFIWYIYINYMDNSENISLFSILYFWEKCLFFNLILCKLEFNFDLVQNYEEFYRQTAKKSIYFY